MNDYSITVDQAPPRNDNHRRQSGLGRGSQLIPLANNPNPRPSSPPTVRRIVILQDRAEIVSVLSSISRNHRQAIYILSGRGYVSEATLLSLPSGEEHLCLGRGKILYLSGWFKPTNPNGQNANGIVHVSLSGVPGGVAVASTLFASGTVELKVDFVCGSGSVVQPDAPGGLR